jgi:hypothetical protein
VRKIVTHIIPLLAVLYSIAFFEVEIGGVEQTWGDVYDTYVTGSHSDNIGSSDYQSVDFDLAFVPVHLLHFEDLVHFASKNTFLELRNLGKLSPTRLFVRNCIWLI